MLSLCSHHATVRVLQPAPAFRMPVSMMGTIFRDKVGAQKEDVNMELKEV